MKIASILFVSAMLVGCGFTGYVKPVMTPSGRGYAISYCDDLSECYQVASEVCPHGYQVIDRGSDQLGSTIIGKTIINHQTETMIIQCTSYGSLSLLPKELK